MKFKLTSLAAITLVLVLSTRTRINAEEQREAASSAVADEAKERRWVAPAISALGVIVSTPQAQRWLSKYKRDETDTTAPADKEGDEVTIDDFVALIPVEVEIESDGDEQDQDEMTRESRRIRPDFGTIFNPNPSPYNPYESKGIFKRDADSTEAMNDDNEEAMKRSLSPFIKYPTIYKPSPFKPIRINPFWKRQVEVDDGDIDVKLIPVEVEIESNGDEHDQDEMTRESRRIRPDFGTIFNPNPSPYNPYESKGIFKRDADSTEAMNGDNDEAKEPSLKRFLYKPPINMPSPSPYNPYESIGIFKRDADSTEVMNDDNEEAMKRSLSPFIKYPTIYKPSPFNPIRPNTPWKRQVEVDDGDIDVKLIPVEVEVESTGNGDEERDEEQ